MPWGSSRLLQNTGTSKGAFHRLAEGTLLNYLELTDCNTMLCSLYELGSLASALRSSLPFRRDGQTDAVPGCMCGQLGAPVPQTAGGDGALPPAWPAPSVTIVLGKMFQSLVGGGQRILPQLRPINISYCWNKNDYIPASTFLVYFKCVTAFYFLPRLCFL